jgi:hypothetical protein
VYGDLKVGEQVIRPVVYVDDLVVLAQEEAVLQAVIERLIKIGRCFGMEMNVEKPKVMGISGQPSPIQVMIDQKQSENVE